MPSANAEVVVAGHICLDLIPDLESSHGSFDQFVLPGGLAKIGPATTALGGAVANTGLALHQLGISTRLLAKVGSDVFGRVIMGTLAGLSDDLIVDPSSTTSYSIVLNFPGVDRAFLHHPGANDSFSASDLAAANCSDCRLLHFGYPPLMHNFYADDGELMAGILGSIQREGLLTSLDMAMPDPATAAGVVDWRRWLQKVLPAVDLFMPSIDEILFMLHRERYLELSKGMGTHGMAALAGIGLIEDTASELLDWGASAVAIKLGDQGLYLQTLDGPSHFEQRSQWAKTDWHRWHGRQLIASCVDVEVVGTTGSGDCTVAGFIAALLNGFSPEQTMAIATAVGGYSVESLDATSNIPDIETVLTRLKYNFQRQDAQLRTNDWKPSDTTGVWWGPQDSLSKSCSLAARSEQVDLKLTP